MDFSGYNGHQKEALLELLLFGMYLDGNLSAIEDRRIGELLDTMEFPSDDARQRFLDAAYTRTRQRSGSAEGIRSFVTDVARHFTTPDLRRRTFNLLEGMVVSDKNVVEKERALLAVLREEFKLRSSAN
ncbi:MAG TPA: TerB family tellurite resistance protein [Candidatus Paceibacterota bacterium]|nr:TerB family tellurite resistance protein [Candidatus Paceibacterota bacterium]